MPQYRAIKTFRSTNLGSPPDYLIRSGSVIHMSDKDAARQNRDVKMVELYTGPRRGEERESPDNKSLPGAPNTKEDAPPDGDDERDDGNGPNADMPNRAAVEDAGGDQGNDSAPPATATGTSVVVEGRRGAGRDKRSSVLRVGRPLPKKT